MKLYLAGLHTSNFNIVNGGLFAKLTDNEKEHRCAVKYYLESYHYIHRQSYVDRIRADGIKVFLDSGAFSAFTKGVKVDLPKYCDYIHRNADIIEVASVLDGIGDPLLTYQNQVAMEELGTRPLPCFHYAEDERYLEYYIANYEYITLGGMVPIATPQLLLWLDRIWGRYLTDGAGRPKLKVHGFGLNAYELMKRYPWYSVDASSWVQQAANGNIVIPKDDGGIHYWPVSSNSSFRKNHDRHLDTITPIEREWVVQEILKRGFEVDHVQRRYLSRWVFNCATYGEINDILSQKDLCFQTDSYTLF